MAITYVGGQTATVTASLSSNTTITFSLSGGSNSTPAAGDLVIVAFVTGSSADRSIGVVTSGYTEIAELYSNNSSSTNLSVSWKIMGSTPDTTVVVSQTGNSSEAGRVAIHVYRGVDSATPFDVSSTTATGVSSGDVDPASITPITSGAKIVAAGGYAYSGFSVNGTLSASYLSNFLSANTGFNRNNAACIGIGNVNWTSGAYNPAAWTANPTGSGFSWAAVTMALRPATVTSVSVSVTGVSATGAIGLAQVTAGASASVSGLSATGSVGAVSVLVGATSVYVFGVSAFGQSGSVLIPQSVTVTTAGSQASGQPGSAAVSAFAAVQAGSVFADAQIGSVVARGSAPVSVSGMSASGAFGSVTTKLGCSVSLIGIQASGAVGQASTKIPVIVYAGAVEAFAQVGVAVVRENSLVILSGEQVAALVGMASSKTTGVVNVWNGFWWQSYPVKVWDGSAWVVKPIYAWNGTGWA